MIKSLRDARLTDGLPRVVAGQKWVQALSEAIGEVFGKTIDFADASQIYTALDDAREEILDTLAINWKVDWYDPEYSLEQKRRIIKTALTVRRLMGTVHAVKVQADAVYPGSEIEEWFDYGGDPGYFRLCVNVTDTDEENPIHILSEEEIERRLITAKRWSAHLENVSYMILHAILYGVSIAGFTSVVPECGTLYCGTYWKTKRLGYSGENGLLIGSAAEGYTAAPDITGMRPLVHSLGYSESVGLSLGANENPVEAYTFTAAQCGMIRCGS